MVLRNRKSVRDCFARVVGVYEDCTALQEVPVALKDEIDGRREERLTWTDEGGQRLARNGAERLFEGDPLILALYWLTDTDQTVPLADQGRHVGDLEAAWLAFPDGAA